jgi:hypothetical protein
MTNTVNTQFLYQVGQVVFLLQDENGNEIVAPLGKVQSRWVDEFGGLAYKTSGGDSRIFWDESDIGTLEDNTGSDYSA